MRTHSQKGFSLTEMSVVLVIIAFIIAAVLKGDAMIKAAQLRAVIAEEGRYKVAVTSFNTKYDAYPGDFDQAASYWAGSTNGDANGQIQFFNSNSVYEGYLAWQHMAYSGMVDVPYPGTRTTGYAALDGDVPKSKTSGGYFFEYGSFGLTDSNVLVLGEPVNIAGGDTTLRVAGNLTPAQAFEIDSKADDGAPNAGSVRGDEGDGSMAGACVGDNNTMADTTDDIYNLATSGKDCILGFRLTGQ